MEDYDDVKVEREEGNSMGLDKIIILVRAVSNKTET